jgi:hypothetical protein
MATRILSIFWTSYAASAKLGSTESELSMNVSMAFRSKGLFDPPSG